NPEKYKVQILYTQVDRDSQNTPLFTSYSYRLNEQQYYYPASTVKFPAAVLALEKLNLLNIEGLTRDTPLRIDSAFSGQTRVIEDSTAKDLRPSLAHYIKKIFLVSDNDAYNRLYEFLGQEYINKRLQEKGYPSVKLIRRLEVSLSATENRATNPFTFFQNGKVLYHQPLVVNEKYFKLDMEEVKQGRGYYKNGELIQEPIDFSYSNFFPLSAQQQLLKVIIFPETVPVQQRFDLTLEDYNFLYQHMSMLPRESEIEAYRDSSKYYDGYLKYFMFGDTRKEIPSNIRSFSKSGQAYGYLLDNAYIIDFEKRLEFFLTAMIQVNENQIYNDDNYEYDDIGLPFLADLGRVIYNYEINREREYQPELSRFLVH
ncbi:MAG: serine hydrolase, partial [bacterium]